MPNATKFLDFPGLRYYHNKFTTLLNESLPQEYQGATASSSGVSGLVPAAQTADKDKYLKGDGTWGTVADTKVNAVLAATTKAYLLGTSTTPTSSAKAVTAIADTAVYLDTTAGRLTAGSFAGNGENITLSTASAAVVTDANKKLVASTTVSATELGYLDGVTSSIQTQLNGKAASSHSHDASDIKSGTLDTARIPSLDASKIASGTIDIARLPAGALPILKVVGNETERFALTSSDVQVGDTVQQTDTGLMYYVKDVSKLNSADGYAVYTAGAATSVPWSGITSKPSTYAPSAHNQASNTINAMTGYSKPSSTSAIGTSDTLNAAIGKLEKALDGKQASGTYLTPSSTLDATKLSGTIPSACYTNTTYSNFVKSGSTAASGLVPSPGTTAGTTKFLCEDASWKVPYTHPTTSGNKHIPSGGSSGKFLGWSADGTAAWVANPNTHKTTHLYAGASGATANAATTTNTTTFLTVVDDTTASNSIQITGSGGTSVTAAEGVITIDTPSLSTITNSEIDAMFA